MMFVKTNMKETQGIEQRTVPVGKYEQIGLQQDLTENSPKMVENTRDPNLSELICAHIISCQEK